MRKIFCAPLVLAATGSLYAIEVTQVAGAAHAYPAMWDLEGKKLASGGI